MQAKIKEVKLHPNIDENDLSIKIRHGIEFIEKGDKVKVIIAFRGREMAHVNIGEELMKRVIETMSERCLVDTPPKLIGRNIIAVLAPKGSGGRQGGGSAKADAQTANEG